MSTLRSLRLLGAVEAGTVSGTQLETFLANDGRRSELSVLLSSRGQSRRMAGSPLTMTAIVNSPAAINIVFQSATKETSAACQAVVSSPIAMYSVSNSAPSLNVLGANPVAWALYSASAYYETHMRTTLANLAGVDPVTYPTIQSIIDDPLSMASVASKPFAMSAVAASPSTVSIVAVDPVAMAMVADSPTAVAILAGSSSAMGVIANSSVAMTEIVADASATRIIANKASALSIISASATAWAAFLQGPNFSANLPAIVANLVGLSTATYPSLASIIADAGALSKVAANKNAVTALAASASALTALSTSPNLGIMLGSTIAMSVLGPNTTAMSSFLGNSGAWAGLFNSSVAKGYMVSSNDLINAIAGNAALITYLKTKAVTTSATGIPDGNATALQAFTGVPEKLLTLSAKEAGIAATFSPYNFGGSPMAGSQAGATLSLTATASLAHVAGYTSMTWNLQGIGVTAATLPIITYVDMT